MHHTDLYLGSKSFGEARKEEVRRLNIVVDRIPEPNIFLAI